MANPNLRKAGVAVVKRASSAQAAVTQTSAVVVTTSATTSAYGYTQAQADAIVAQVNKLVADIALLTTLANEHRTVLVNAGLAKGGA